MSNALQELVTRGESGAAGYNAYNRGTYRDAQGRDHIRGSAVQVDFSTMTLGHVQDRQHLPSQDENRLFAVGRYQIIPDTMDTAAAKLNLRRDEPFTPQLQDRIFSEYLIVEKRPAIHDYIVGKPGATLVAAQSGLALEWASFGDPNKAGRSHYGGANHASITPEQSANALNQMRQEYQASVSKGLSSSDAWRATIASDGQSTHKQEQSTLHFPRHGSLHQGSHGGGVSKLQTQLNALGYRDARGHALETDGRFGPNTRHAVEAFQRDHDLRPDGIAGHDTLNKLRELSQQQSQTLHLHARPSTQVDGRAHPDHALFQQALAGVHQLDARHSRTPDFQSDQLAASLVVAARRTGLDRIDGVSLSDDASKAFAIQGAPGSPLMKFASVSTVEAINTTIAQSTQALEQIKPQQDQSQAHQTMQDMQRSQTQRSPGPAMAM